MSYYENTCVTKKVFILYFSHLDYSLLLLIDDNFFYYKQKTYI